MRRHHSRRYFEDTFNASSKRRYLNAKSKMQDDKDDDVLGAFIFGAVNCSAVIFRLKGRHHNYSDAAPVPSFPRKETKERRKVRS
jgi:hypothetical protein